MNVLAILKGVFAKISFGGGVLAAVAIVLTMFSLMIDTGGRWLKIPILGVFEFNSLLIGICIYLAIAFTQGEKKHIAVSLLTDRLPKRVAAILDIPVLGICVILFGWTSYLYYQAARVAFVNWEVAQGISHFPLFPLKLIMFIGMVMLTIRLVIDIGERVSQAVTPETKETAKQGKNKTEEAMS